MHQDQHDSSGQSYRELCKEGGEEEDRRSVRRKADLIRLLRFYDALRESENKISS